MAELKPIQSVQKPVPPDKLVAAANQQFATNVLGRKENPLPVPYTLDDDSADWYKLMSWGYPGAGKTKAIEAFVLAGERVYVVTTDLGGSGLRTVKQLLKKRGRADLLANVAGVDISQYEHAKMFLDDPTKIDPKIWDWKPTMLAWEGYSYFQTTVLDEWVLSLDPIAKNGISDVEMRNEGAFMIQTDWNAMRRLTMRSINKFLNMHNPITGDKLHKYVTLQEDEPEKDDKGKPIPGGKRKPLLYTAAKNQIAAGFDLVLQMVATEKVSGGTEYQYKTVGNENLYAKNRELPVKAVEPADMLDLWCRIKGISKPEI